MDREPLEYFRWFYAGVNQFDVDEVAERWHEDLEIVQSADVPDTEGTFHGYEGLARLNAEILESYEDVVWDPQEVFDLGGERYLVLVLATARGRASGVPLEAKIGHLVTLRDGRAARLNAYLGWDAARHAAGLGDSRSRP